MEFDRKIEEYKINVDREKQESLYRDQQVVIFLKTNNIIRQEIRNWKICDLPIYWNWRICESV